MSNNSNSNTTPRSSRGSEGRTPTYEELFGMVSQLQESITTLEERQSAKAIKVRPPEPFDGTRYKLRPFITQLDLYVRMNRSKLIFESDKVLLAATYLTGPAFDWFEPTLRDFQEKDEQYHNDNTTEVFSSFTEFKKRLQGTFGDIDATRNAERKLWRLKQTGSVAKLVSDFQQIITHLNWDETMYIAKFEEMLKPEIQEKLVWMERPTSLNELFERAVKIDNTLYDLRVRQKESRYGNTFRGNPRTSHYRSNDKRPAQPRSQGYEDPYGPRPMELDATQHRPFVSDKERERRRKEKLCFTCGKPGHMTKACRQRQNVRPQQQRDDNKQLHATQERGAYDTTGIVNPELRATNDSGWHMQEASDEHGGPWRPRTMIVPNLSPLRRLMEEQTTLTTEEIDEIMSSSEEEYWPNERMVGSDSGSDKAHIRTDGSEKAINEPVHEKSLGELPNQDWSVNDFLDEEYGAQWNGHDPNVEELHEIPETPQNATSGNDEHEEQILAEDDEGYTKSSVYSPISKQQLWSKRYTEQRKADEETNTDVAAYFIDDVVISLQENPKRLSKGLKELFNELNTYCPHQNLKCWERTNETWDEHLRKCDQHPYTCPYCGQNNGELWGYLRDITTKRLRGPIHSSCKYDWCDCVHYREHPKHNQLPWIVCYSHACGEHYDRKKMAHYFPERSRKYNDSCPCWDWNCACRGYLLHPEHSSMHWTACYEDDCIVHFEPKDYYPSPRRLRQPRWQASLSATQRGYHLKFTTPVLNQLARVMVDSGATGNYMDPRFQRQLGILGIEKAQPEPISGLNGENLGSHLTVESGSVPMAVAEHEERINFDVTPLGQYDIVLGIPWLRNHNPEINWKTGQMNFVNCNCPKTTKGPSQREAGTSPRSTGRRPGRYVKQPRGGLRMNNRETNDTATNIVLAATRASERHWLMNLPGWAPGATQKYCEYLMDEDISKRSAPIEEYRSERVDSNQEASDSELGSWEWIDHKELAATTQEPQIPQEYIEFQHLFKQPERPELPDHGPHDHRIPLMEGKTPTCKKIYPMSERESKILREYIEEQLAKGFIRPSTSPAGHRVLFVPKKDGSLRLCADYRPLNAITIKDRHPLPRVDEMQDRIRGAKWFTKFDIVDAYNRLRIARGEEWKTTIRTKYGHYEYLVMPFGLTNAPASFQRFIYDVLGVYLDIFVIVYLDDILVFSNTFEEHVQHVKKVLQKLEEAKLRLKLKKCEFHVQETEFLGHWITTEGIQMDKNKVQAILDWPELKNTKEVQQFTGLVNYYRRFLKDYSQFMTPLFKLLKKGQEFQWGPEQRQAFQQAKERIVSAPALVQFDPEKETTIETDA